MSKKDWKPLLERVRQSPDDAEALDELEQYLSKRPTQAIKHGASNVGRAGRFGARMFLGAGLYKAIVQAWDAWSSFFYGTYESPTPSPWPEVETRDVAAAAAARFLRIGMFGILVALLPALLMFFQTSLMIIQVWQVNTQNDIIRKQNGLLRQQFSIGYTAQISGQLYAEKECEEKGECEPENPGVLRVNAAQALVDLSGIEEPAGADSEEGAEKKPLAKLVGARLDDTEIIGHDFSEVNFKDANFMYTNISESNFSRSNLQGARFGVWSADELSRRRGKYLGDKTTRRVTLDSVNFTGAKFYDDRFIRQPEFNGVVFSRCTFDDAVFYPADKPAVNKPEGVRFILVERFKDSTFHRANLIGANFQGLSLLRVEFDEANLQKSNFTKSVLTTASFKGADLSDAVFTDAKLTDVDFTGAKLPGKKFSGLSLKNVTCPDGKKGTCGLK